MFKKALVLAIVLLLACSVFAVRLIEPVSKELTEGTNFAGTVAPGNNVELIFSKELTNKYTSVEVTSELPAGFNYVTSAGLESLKVSISVPGNAPNGDYPVSVRLSGPGVDDLASLSFTVVRGQLDVSPSVIVEQTVVADSRADYKFFFVNNTDSSAVFDLTANLPANWTNENTFASKTVPQKIIVPRHSSTEQSFSVFPRVQGKKEFSVIVNFEDSKKQFSFAVNALPTLRSKLQAPVFGLPFFSFSVLPSYFADAIVSLAWK